MRGRFILFIVYLIFALYFLNFGLGFISMPESFATVDKWIIAIGGILLIAGAINHLRVRRMY